MGEHRAWVYFRALLLAVTLAPVAMAAHEVMHVAIWSMLGVPAALTVVPWHTGLPLTVFSLHAAVLSPPSQAAVPLWEVVANNGLGPGVVAAILLLLWLSIGRNSAVARAALMANIAMLIFFSLIEMAYRLIEGVGHAEGDFLLSPALNYGGALLVILLTLGVSLRPRFRSGPRRQISLLSQLAS
jgi:hypothetical protein